MAPVGIHSEAFTVFKTKESHALFVADTSHKTKDPGSSAAQKAAQKNNVSGLKIEAPLDTDCGHM